jgi:TonB family protein
MSAAPKSIFAPAQPMADQNSWSPKPLGWRLVFNDRLLWIALGLSFIAHIVILAPRYGIKLPERGDKSLTVSFRAASQSITRINEGGQQPTVITASKRKPARAEVIKPIAKTTSAAILPSVSDIAARSAPQVSTSIPSTPAAGGTVGTGRRVTLTPNMKDYRYSQYLSDWRNKVERIGAMNYPEEARGKFFGSLVLSVALRPDGSVDRIIVVRSSGNKVLDEAAKRIVMMGSPFAPFPPDIRKETDYLDITRTWTFTRGDALETR